MIGQQSLNLTHNWKENGFTYPVLKFLWHFCILSVQVLCDKVYDMGGGRVWRRAKLYNIILEWPLNNLETPMKQPWNIVEIPPPMGFQYSQIEIGTFLRKKDEKMCYIPSNQGKKMSDWFLLFSGHIFKLNWALSMVGLPPPITCNLSYAVPHPLPPMWWRH